MKLIFRPVAKALAVFATFFVLVVPARASAPTTFDQYETIVVSP